jgi:hypothetical protein
MMVHLEAEIEQRLRAGARSDPWFGNNLHDLLPAAPPDSASRWG